MSRPPGTFRQADVTRAIRGVEKAGRTAARVLIDRNGRIEITLQGDEEKPAPSADLDRELNEWEARHGR